APIELVSHRRSAQVAAGILVPQYLAGGRVKRHQPFRLVGEDEASGRREDPVAAGPARSDPTPADLSGLVVDREQHILAPQARAATALVVLHLAGFRVRHQIADAESV